MARNGKKNDIETKEFVLETKKTLLFDAKDLGWSNTPAYLSIKNPTKGKYLWKAKSSNNRMFKIHSPIGFIDSKGSASLEVVHVAGILIPLNGAHHISIYYVKVDEDPKERRSFWNTKRPQGCRHVGVHFNQRKEKLVIGADFDEKMDEAAFKKLKAQMLKDNLLIPADKN
ncbi:unnamed protein product [Caenorhabditis sp. 36 PRJEB53466]|nr:unnamed protein product [Caenorhabditis sp. 36 PRJEB53466]